MQETNHKFIIDAIGKEQLNLCFSYLEQCKGVVQMEKHHPEGDVFNHSLQCLCWALRESDDIDLVLAAMLHDIGKVENSRGHEKIAIKWLSGICSVKTLWLIEHHMRIWDLLKGNMKRRSKINYLIEHCWLPELIQLARFDKLARNPAKQIKYDKDRLTNRLNKCCERHFIHGNLKFSGEKSEIDK